MANDLVVGAWRNGLKDTTRKSVEEVMKRYNGGMRQLPYESTVAELAILLDGLDAFAADLLMSESVVPKTKAAKSSE